MTKQTRNGDDAGHTGALARWLALGKRTAPALYPLALLAILRIAIYFLLERDGVVHPGMIYRRLVFSVLLYCSWSLFINRYAAVAASLLTELLLLKISAIKISQIGEPLSFIDMTEIAQNVHLTGYASPILYVIAGALLVAIAIGWYSRDRGWTTLAKRAPLALLLPLMFTILLTSHGVAAAVLKHEMDTLRLRHRDEFVPAKSVWLNGIISHLMLTRNMSLCPSPARTISTTTSSGACCRQTSRTSSSYCENPASPRRMTAFQRQCGRWQTSASRHLKC